MNRVLILGGGPSGLISAWAAMKNGWDVVLFDKQHPVPNKAANAGVFVLHDDLDIPSLPVAVLETKVMGIPETMDWREYPKRYSQKVYGNDDTPNSALKYMNSRKVYDPVKALTFARDIIESGGGHFVDGTVENIGQVNTIARSLDVSAIISTVPLTVFHPSPPSEKVWVYNGVAPEDEAFMLYNLAPHVPWYRCSAVFGKFVMEFVPGYTPPEKDGNIQVRKVLPWGRREDCLRHLAMLTEAPILFTGRFGAWNKDTLVDTTFREASDWLCKLWT